MFDFFKIVALCHCVLSSVIICESRNIDHGADSDLRIFFYPRDFPQVFTKVIYGQRNPFLIHTDILKQNQSTILSLEFYPEEKTFFWTTTNGELSSTTWPVDKNKIMTLDENRDKDQDDEDISNILFNVLIKDNNKLLHSEKNWYPRSMALDDVGKKLYIADSYERSIDVFDLDGKNKARIFTSDYLIPFEIAVDPSEGLLFLYGINFLERKSELYRMNMDGSDVRLMIDTVENLKEVTLRVKANLVVDRENKLLYYKASSNNIATIDYNGHGRDLILKDQNVEYFGIYKNRLLWTKRHVKDDTFIDVQEFRTTTFSCDWQYPLWSCNLSDQIRSNSSISCESISEVKAKTKDFRMNAFKIFDFTPREKPANPCLETGNSCEDHCLLKSTGVANKLTFGCACRLGRKINDDKKTCSDIEEQKIDEDSIPNVYEKVLFIYNTTTANSTKEGSDQSPIFNISANFAKQFLHGAPELVWDDALNHVYKVTPDSYYRGIVKYENDDQYFVIKKSVFDFPVTVFTIYETLAYDWVSKNLYYLATRGSDEYDLFVIDTKHPEKEMLLDGEIDTPRTMAVHPYRGYLFVSTYKSSHETERNSKITRYNTDGKDALVVANSSSFFLPFTVDLAEDKIYWIDGRFVDDEFVMLMMSSNLDGSDAKVVTKSRYTDKIGLIRVYGDNIYLRTIDHYNPFYVYKKSGELIGEYPLEVLEVGLNNVLLTKQKVNRMYTQYLSKKNPCVHNNGGCEFFCFAVPMNNSDNLQKMCSS